MQTGNIKQHDKKKIYLQALSISTLDLSCRVICMRHEHNGRRRYHLLTVWLFDRLWDLSVFLGSNLDFCKRDTHDSLSDTNE